MRDAQTKEAPSPREIELDFLRGIAILMVVDFHNHDHALLFYPFILLGFPHFGWAGVDVFFVLSGFLIGGLLVKEWKLHGRIDSRRFLIRRGFKIWPQYYVFLLILLAAGHRSLHGLWGNILNIQNYAGGVPHTWSLAVEEHAYLLIVLCLAVAAWRKVRMRSLFLFFAAAIVAVSSLRMTLLYHGFVTSISTHTRIDGILYGILLAMLYHYTPDTFRRIQSWRYLWLALVVGALLSFRFSPPQPWAVSLRIDFANWLGVALLMLLYRHRQIDKQRPALYRFIAWLGLYSYGIYLWHVSAMAPTMAIWPRLPHWLLPAWQRTAPSVLGILIGILLTKLVELPTLKLRDRLYPRPVDSAVGTPAEQEAAMNDAPHSALAEQAATSTQPNVERPALLFDTDS